MILTAILDSNSFVIGYATSGDLLDGIPLSIDSIPDDLGINRYLALIEQGDDEEKTGYIIPVPVPETIHKPIFQPEAWRLYQDAVISSEEAYKATVEEALASYHVEMDEWLEKPIEDRGDEPVYVAPDYIGPERPTLWVEGLTDEEIAALHPPAEPSPTDLLGAEITSIKLQSIKQQAIIINTGEQLVQAKLDSVQQQQMISELSAELAVAKLEIIKLKGEQTI